MLPYNETRSKTYQFVLPLLFSNDWIIRCSCGLKCPCGPERQSFCCDILRPWRHPYLWVKNHFVFLWRWTFYDLTLSASLYKFFEWVVHNGSFLLRNSPLFSSFACFVSTVKRRPSACFVFLLWYVFWLWCVFTVIRRSSACLMVWLS